MSKESSRAAADRTIDGACGGGPRGWLLNAHVAAAPDASISNNNNNNNNINNNKHFNHALDHHVVSYSASGLAGMGSRSAAQGDVGVNPSTAMTLQGDSFDGTGRPSGADTRPSTDWPPAGQPAAPARTAARQARELSHSRSPARTATCRLLAPRCRCAERGLQWPGGPGLRGGVVRGC